MNVSEFISKVAPHIGKSHGHFHPPSKGVAMGIGAGKLASLATGVGLLRTAVAKQGWQRWGLFLVGGVLLYHILAGNREPLPPARGFSR